MEGASAESQLVWGPAVPVDLLPAPARGIALNRVSCATPSLCVAVDSAGNVVTSTDPSGGTSAWTVTPVDVPHDIRDVSCVAPSVCVAVDENGNILSSTDPTGGAGAWAVANLDPGGRGINGISCASPSLCVAVDNAGQVLSSTNPTGGVGAWSLTPVDLNSQGYKGAYPIYAVSCTAEPWCVAEAFPHEVLMSSNPTGNASAWSILDLGGGFLTGGVSCVLSSLCAATNSEGAILTLSSPGAAAGWQAMNVDPAPTMIPGSSLPDVSCASSSRCIAVDNRGNVVTSSDPTAGSEAWTTTNIDGPTLISGVSCPTVSLCVAVDQPGRILVGRESQTGRISLTDASLAARHGVVTLKLECVGNAQCAGKLVLSIRVKRRHHARSTAIPIANAVSFLVAPGAIGAVKIHLRRLGQAELNTKPYHLAGTLAAIQSAPPPAHTTQISVELAQEPHGRHA